MSSNDLYGLAEDPDETIRLSRLNRDRVTEQMAEDADQTARRSQRLRSLLAWGKPMAFLSPILGFAGFLLVPISWGGVPSTAGQVAAAFCLFGAVAMSFGSCAFVAVAKGHHPAWGIAGIASFMGFLMVVVLPDRAAAMRNTTTGTAHDIEKQAALLRDYEQLPWFRRGGLMGTLTFLGVFVVPVCIAVWTGPVFHPPRAGDKTLREWHFVNRVAAMLILIAWLVVVGLACCG